MESIDLDNLNNSSQFYLDAMEQLKKEYEKMEKRREDLKQYTKSMMKNNLELNGMIEGLNMLMENIELPDEVQGMLDIITRKSAGYTNMIVEDISTQLLRGSENIDR